MSELLEQQAMAFLRARFPRAVVVSRSYNISSAHSDPSTTKRIVGMVATDRDAGVRQLLLAVPQLGSLGECGLLAERLPYLRSDIDGPVEFTSLDTLDPHAAHQHNKDFHWSSTTVLFTDELAVDPKEVREVFRKISTIEIVDNANRGRHVRSDLPSPFSDFRSVFISYGGPDAAIAKRIHDYLTRHGVRAWFFETDARPGQKLHRMMSEGVNGHDHVLLICSINSLQRPGVLNELERVFEREAREGGTAVLVPVRLDSFVFSDEWAPKNPDVAHQLRSRVVGDLSNISSEPGKFDTEMKKVLSVLHVKRR